jgi:DNA-binding Lrp family transcriptional regulator
MRHVLEVWEFLMVEAVVLIQAKVGESSAVASAIAQLDGVMSADVVSGPYDVIVRTQAENIDELGRMVVSKMQSVKGVTRTLTCPILRL